MRTLFLLALTVACFSNITFAQSNQTSPSNQKPQDPKVDSQNEIFDPIFTSEQFEKLPFITHKPRLSLQQALRIAESYARREKINLSSHFLIEAKILPSGSDVRNVDGRHWSFKWVVYKPADEPEIVVIVSMTGKASRPLSMNAASASLNPTPELRPASAVAEATRYRGWLDQGVETPG